MTPSKKWITFSVETILIAMMLSAAAVLVLPKALGWHIGTVLSGSMSPKYPVQSLLLSKPVKPQNIRVGDVIEFHKNNSRDLVSHRVVGINKTGDSLEFVTKGDANNTPDAEPVPEAAVTGRVVTGIPLLGRFVHFVHTNFGYVLFLVCPALLLMGSEIENIRKELRPTHAGKYDAITSQPRMRYAKASPERASALP